MIDDCSALILAGGDSRRMGQDKAALVLNGMTLLESVTATMQAIFPKVIVSVRQPRDGLNVPQVCDEQVNGGPLAGLIAGLAQADTPWVFAVACDMPFVVPELIEQLAGYRTKPLPASPCQGRSIRSLPEVGQAGNPHSGCSHKGGLGWVGVQAVVPMIDGYPQPLAAFYASSALDAMRVSLAAGDKSLRGMLQKLEVRYVSEAELRECDPQLRSFFDLDTPQDFLAAQGEDAMDGMTVAAAQRCVIEAMQRCGAEAVPLQQALGRVLAEDIRANRDQPPYDVSAMDGFALRSADVANAPATLAIIEDIKAGDMPVKTVQAGQCSRIMTGAPLPQGADAVIRVEDTQALDDAHVQINVAVKLRNDIRDRGENMKQGEVVLQAGTEITPGVVGMLAMVKCATVQVYRQPRVAILSTGDELEGLDDPFDANKIPDANSYTLMAQVQALGIEPVLLGIARDDPDALKAALQQGLQYDVLLVSGGTSVGVHDYVRPTLEALEVQMKFWRVAMKPGHPMAFGVRSAATTTYIFGLPGNPVSSMVCFEEFVAPALRCMMGHGKLHRRTVTARLARDVKHKQSRTEFVRVMLHKERNELVAMPTGDQGSGILRSMAMAEGLMVVDAKSKGVAAGEQVTVQLLDGTAYQDEAGGEW